MSNPTPQPAADKCRARRDSALGFLFGRIDYERMAAVPYRKQEFKLDRMRELVRRLGDPHQDMPVVHIAGTKGKGSTAVMIAGVLAAAGYRIGLFTSPHLERIEERIAVDGRQCPSDDFAALIERIRPEVGAMDREAADAGNDEIGPTYFELTTAAALLHFQRSEVDVAVLEVGLGGRLDSTNICMPQVSVITSISFDHTRQLGNTLDSIAREKAGIVKPGVPVISGVAEEEPREAIREICRERGCRVVELGVDFHFDYRPPRALDRSAVMGRLDWRFARGGRAASYLDIELGMLGHHQAANAAVALAALDELARDGWSISEAAVRKGLAEAVAPARAELLTRRPAIVVDAAHNLASVDALLATLDECFSPLRRLLIFATTQEKDIQGMVQRAVERFDRVIFTRYTSNPRSVPPEELAALAQQLTGQTATVCAEPSDAWDEISRLAHPDDLVCVTGSFFIAAEIRRIIADRPLRQHSPGTD
jgi:dihydrofolate synthase/folylpolyglutamate synthase